MISEENINFIITKNSIKVYGEELSQYNKKLS
jgi:hypothetical protein